MAAPPGRVAPFPGWSSEGAGPGPWNVLTPLTGFCFPALLSGGQEGLESRRSQRCLQGLRPGLGDGSGGAAARPEGSRDGPPTGPSGRRPRGAGPAGPWPPSDGPCPAEATRAPQPPGAGLVRWACRRASRALSSQPGPSPPGHPAPLGPPDSGGGRSEMTVHWDLWEAGFLWGVCARTCVCVFCKGNKRGFEESS